MDAKRLEQQIERYFDAALSVDEERGLARLLMVTEVPEHLERDKQVLKVRLRKYIVIKEKQLWLLSKCEHKKSMPRFPG